MCLGRRDECLLTGPGKGGCDECSPEEGIRRRHGTEVFNSMAHSRASKWLAVAGGEGERCGYEEVVWEQLERNWALWWRAVYTGPTGFEQMLEESQGGRY